MKLSYKNQRMFYLRCITRIFKTAIDEIFKFYNRLHFQDGSEEPVFKSGILQFGGCQWLNLRIVLFEVISVFYNTWLFFFIILVFYFINEANQLICSLTSYTHEWFPFFFNELFKLFFLIKSEWENELMYLVYISTETPKLKIYW